MLVLAVLRISLQLAQALALVQASPDNKERTVGVTLYDVGIGKSL